MIKSIQYSAAFAALVLMAGCADAQNTAAGTSDTVAAAAQSPAQNMGPAQGMRPAPPAPATGPMGFFITSTNMGDGANLGGLSGADAHCQSLAAAAGGGDRVWRAYLSTQATDDAPAVNAKDRIGSGPWFNAKGKQIASGVDNLHYDNSAINREHAVTENGDKVMSRSLGDPVGQHDILTGTTLSGMAPPPGEDMTCSNWTSNDEGRAIVGHHDRYRRDVFGSPWNDAHPSRGCSAEALESSGGAGLFYCFAAD